MVTLIPNTRKEIARRKLAYAKRSQVLNLRKLIVRLEQKRVGATTAPDKP